MPNAASHTPIFWGALFEDLYQTLMGLEPARKILELINARKWTVKDSGATHRTINHWTAEGLIDDQREMEGQGWRKFSLCEIVWIRAVCEMREFGLPLDKIRKAYNSLFYSAGGKYSTVEMACATFLCINKPVHAVFIIVLKDGTAKLATYESIKEQEKVNGLGAPYLRINLNELIRKSAEDNDYAAPKPNSTILSAQEQEILKAVREKDFHQMNIHVSDGDIRAIEKTKTIAGSERLNDLLMAINYGEVTFKIEGGRIKSTKRTTKKKTS